MFNGKKIKELEEKVDDLELRIADLAYKVNRQSDDIDKLYVVFANKIAKIQTQEKTQTQESKPKAKPKYRPKKNGKETPKSAE